MPSQRQISAFHAFIAMHVGVNYPGYCIGEGARLRRQSAGKHGPSNPYYRPNRYYVLRPFPGGGVAVLNQNRTIPWRATVVMHHGELEHGVFSVGEGVHQQAQVPREY